MGVRISQSSCPLTSFFELSVTEVFEDDSLPFERSLREAVGPDRRVVVSLTPGKSIEQLFAVFELFEPIELDFLTIFSSVSSSLKRLAHDGKLFRSMTMAGDRVVAMMEDLGGEWGMIGKS